MTTVTLDLLVGLQLLLNFQERVDLLDHQRCIEDSLLYLILVFRLIGISLYLKFTTMTAKHFKAICPKFHLSLRNYDIFGKLIDYSFFFLVDLIYQNSFDIVLKKISFW